MILRILCYTALVVVGFGFLSLLLLRLSGFCPRMEAGGVSCKSPLAQRFAKLALVIVLFSVYTGVPVLLAFGGVGFAVYDMFFYP